MKKIFSFFAALLFAGSMMATESVVYTLTPTSGSNQGYANNCDIDVDGITWNLTGNSQMDPWRIGGKNITDTDRELYSKDYIESNITKIEVTHGTASGITVNSMTVTVASDAAFTEVISTLTPTFAANSTLTINRPEGADWTNAYYKFTYNVTVSGSGNKFLQFTEAKFYAAEEAPSTATLVSIAISGEPTKTAYYVGDTFSPAGLVVTATYDDATTKNVTNSVEWSFDPAVFAADDDMVIATATYEDQEAEEIYEVSVTELPILSCADVQAVTEDTDGELNEVTVLFVRGGNIFVKDETGMTQVYKNGTELVAGDVVSGMKGKATLYNGTTPEFVPSNDPSAWTITHGEAPAFDAMTVAPAATNVNGVYCFKNVTFAEDVEFTSSAAVNATATINDETFILRNNYRIAYNFAADTQYDIVGVVNIYNTNVQVYFISAEESPNTGTAVDHIVTNETIEKTIIDGTLYIIRNGHMYETTGEMVR